MTVIKIKPSSIVSAMRMSKNYNLKIKKKEGNNKTIHKKLLYNNDFLNSRGKKNN